MSTTENTLISIIIPVYNVEKYIATCLNSILNQDFKDYEVILINDGSSDSSKEICENFKEKFSKIEVVHKINEGVGVARNVGLQHAKGKYIYFLDSDDFLEPNFFEFIAPSLTQNYDIVMFGFNRVNEQGEYINTTKPPSKIAQEVSNDRAILAEILQSGCGLSLWDKLIKRELIQKKTIVFDNKRRGQDFTFMIKVFNETNSIKSINDCFLNYRMVFNAKQKTDNEIVENHIENFQKLYHLMKNGVNKSEKKFLTEIFGKWFLFVIPINLSNNKNMDRKTKNEKISLILSNDFVSDFINKNKWWNFNISYVLVINYFFLQYRLLNMYLLMGTLFSFYRKKIYN